MKWVGKFTNSLGWLTSHGGTHFGINPGREELSAMCRPRKEMVGGKSNIPSRTANVDEQTRVLPSQYSRKCRLPGFGNSVCHGPSILTRLTGLAVRLAGIAISH